MSTLALRSPSPVRLLLRWALAVAALVGMTAHAAQFPSRPITIVVPYAPGASPDTLARLLAPKLSANLGQPVTIENRPGASGNIGGAYVARASNDGHVILLATQPMVAINPTLFPKMGYDPVRDLTPITLAANVVMALSVNPDVPAHSVAELIAYLKRHPGTTYGTSGIGTPMHLAGLRIERATGVDLTHVAYRGGAQVLNDLIGGQIRIGIVDLASSAPFAESGRIRILAIGERSRFDGAPQLPTLGESIAGFSLETWFGFFGPADLSSETVDRWNRAMRLALDDPTLRDKLHALGIVTHAEGPDALTQRMQQDTELFGREIRDNAITMP